MSEALTEKQIDARLKQHGINVVDLSRAALKHLVLDYADLVKEKVMANLELVREANRRDQKWMDGIDEVVGAKLNYTDPDHKDGSAKALRAWADAVRKEAGAPPPVGPIFIFPAQLQEQYRQLVTGDMMIPGDLYTLGESTGADQPDAEDVYQLKCYPADPAMIGKRLTEFSPATFRAKCVETPRRFAPKEFLDASAALWQEIEGMDACHLRIEFQDFGAMLDEVKRLGLPPQ